MWWQGLVAREVDGAHGAERQLRLNDGYPSRGKIFTWGSETRAQDMGALCIIVHFVSLYLTHVDEGRGRLYLSAWCLLQVMLNALLPIAHCAEMLRRIQSICMGKSCATHSCSNVVEFVFQARCMSF